MHGDTRSVRSSSPTGRDYENIFKKTKEEIQKHGTDAVSTYDWPMTSTEKLMDKYAYKAVLMQYTRRIDHFWPLLSSRKPETVLHSLSTVNQLLMEAWQDSDKFVDLVPALHVHLKQKDDLNLLLNLFTTGASEMRILAGEVIESFLSNSTASSPIPEATLKPFVRSIIDEYDKKDEESTRLSVGLLEALFSHGPETCRITVENGGLDCLIETCKTRVEIEILLHTAAAFSNLAIFGGSEIHKLMVAKHVPVWLYILASHSDPRIKFYGCLAFCAILSTPDIDKSAKECDTMVLIRGFLKLHKPEDMAKLDDKYRSGRTSQYLAALSPLLHSNIPEVSALATFQLAMEAPFQVFAQLGFTARIKEIASNPEFEMGSRFAVQVLNAMGEAVPYKLSQAVPLWSVKDVQFWLKKVGYSQYSDLFTRHRVDGDLLLQTTNYHLVEDLQMDSAYEQMRFLRELNSLKRSADYSAVDRGQLDSWMINLDAELSVYTYQMLLKGVDRPILIHLNEEILRDVCGIANGVHRWKILRAIRDAKHEADLDLVLLRKKVDIFISYRRSTGSQLASLLKVHLQLAGYKVFLDVDRLSAGQFNASILMNVRAAKHFILVLSPQALDPCIGDDECQDWVHLELKTALESRSNIIPVQEKGFAWPPAEKLPADMRALCSFNAVQWVHDYQQACIDKLLKHLLSSEARGSENKARC